MAFSRRRSRRFWKSASRGSVNSPYLPDADWVHPPIVTHLLSWMLTCGVPYPIGMKAKRKGGRFTSGEKAVSRVKRSMRVCSCLQVFFRQICRSARRGTGNVHDRVFFIIALIKPKIDALADLLVILPPHCAKTPKTATGEEQHSEAEHGTEQIPHRSAYRNRGSWRLVIKVFETMNAKRKRNRDDHRAIRILEAVADPCHLGSRVPWS